jgi:muramoyltetrapeptide carboxypeptidase
MGAGHNHIFDELGYLAGTDEDRLADINEALRDPGLKAIVATRGGKGAYRIAGDLDFEAARRYPKMIIGFSEITFLHMVLLKNCGYAGIHGAPWDETFGRETAESFVKAVMGGGAVVVRSSEAEHTRVLTTSGKAVGRLIGGNQDSFAIANGWGLPDMDGAILLLEGVGMKLGHIDRQLTMLMNSGALRGIRGVAVGQYTDCGSDETTQGDWTEIDVLRDRLSKLGVPVLGGLPLGHGENPIAVPIGTMAVLDADAGTLTVEAV